MSVLERCCYRDSRPVGAGFTAAAVLPVVGGALLVGTAVRRRSTASVLWNAAATWCALGGRSLGAAGSALARSLDAGEVDRSRALIPTLCGRDPHTLDAPAMARAGVESVAENTSDAVVAPLFWAAVAGAPGALGYRAVNTLDAMVGHRSPRYRRFGTASARLDDLANVVPARLTGLLTLVFAGAVAGDRRAGVRAWRQDAGGHPSPNAGVCEATAAGVLGVQLGGVTVYDGRVDDRPQLGDGRVPGPDDLRRAVRLSRHVQVGAALLAAVAASHAPRTRATRGAR